MENSAVEWFAKELYEKFEMKGDGKVFDELLEQAKEMEKEQIIDSFVECWKANVPEGVECKLYSEQYYKETYKSE